jgi:hypothetical protein
MVAIGALGALQGRALAEATERASGSPTNGDAERAVARVLQEVPSPMEALAAVGATSETMTTVAMTTATGSTPAPHRLKGIRARAEGATLRLIFLFDAPTPYALRLEPDGRRATLTLIHAQVDSLPPEMARLNDPRLEGVWLRRQDPAMATLDLGLPATAERVEHFSLADPPAVVIDLTPLAPEAIPLGGPFLPAPMTSAAATTTGLARVGVGAVVPRAWLQASQEAQSATSLTRSQTTFSGARQEGQETSAGTLLAQRTPSPSDADLGPRAMDYEGFPIQEIHVKSALGREMLDDFLDRRWGSAFDKGLSFLANNPMADEANDVLYMLAEARWQLGKLAAAPPVGDMANFYRQAVRAQEDGPLAGFGHARLAQAAAKERDPLAALAHINQAMAECDAPMQERLTMLRAKCLSEAGKTRESLATLDELARLPLGANARLEVAKLKGSILLAADDAEGAWKAYGEASAIDSRWMYQDYGAWEKLARAAHDTGHYKESMESVQELLRNYAYRDKSENYKLLLLHADLLEKLGETDVAEKTYETVLQEFGRTPMGADIQRDARQRFPEDVLQSEGRFCMLLWKEGKIVPAMTELNRVQAICLKEGIDRRPLGPIVTTILPDFMRAALAVDKPFETIQGWRLLGDRVQDPLKRGACLEALGEAMERMGLYREALAQIDSKPASSLTPDETIRRARLLSRLGRPAESMALLEHPLPASAAFGQQAQADALLAEAYRQLGMPLLAAQAFQTVVERPDAVGEQRGQAALAAGQLFLDNRMPLQAIEIGVEALLLENDVLKAKHAPWNAATSRALRLMLARAFYERADLKRAGLLLQDCLDLPDGLSAEDVALARMLSAQCQQRLGHPAAARAACQAILADKNSPRLYSGQARQMQALLDWDAQRPQWAVLARPADDQAKTNRP